MKTACLNLSPEGLLEIISYDSREIELALDIMNEQDVSLSKWEKVKNEYSTTGYAVSSAIDFPSEFNLDDSILNSFINSMFRKNEEIVMAS